MDHSQATKVCGNGRRTRDRFSKFLFLRHLFEQQTARNEQASQHEAELEEEQEPEVLPMVDRRSSCARQTSTQSLPTPSSSISSSISCGSSRRSSLNRQSRRANPMFNSMVSCDSAKSRISQYSNASSTASSIADSWADREDNRKSQTGPNPFAFY